MEQLFATFYPRTKKVEPILPRSQRYLISAQKKNTNHTNYGEKRPYSFSATRQNTFNSANVTAGKGWNLDKENSRPKHHINFEDFMIEKYQRVKKKQQDINPYAQQKLMLRDASNALNSYKDINVKNQEEQNYQLESENSSFFRKKDIKSPSQKNKLNNIVDISERISSTPSPQGKHIQNEYSVQQNQYSQIDEEQNYLSSTSNQINYQSNYKTDSKPNQLTQYTQQNNRLTTQNQYQDDYSDNYANQQNYDKEQDDDQELEQDEDEGFENFYVTLPPHRDTDAQKRLNSQNNNNNNINISNTRNQTGMDYKPSQIIQTQDEEVKTKKDYQDYDEYLERKVNKEMQKCNKYPFFITKINILDKPNIYDVLQDKNVCHTTESNGETQMHQPNFMKGFIKHDIHYIQSKNMRAALSAASKKRQNTSSSQKRNNKSVLNTAMNTQGQDLFTQFSEKNQLLDLNKNKNLLLYSRDSIGYKDNKIGQQFNQMYESFNAHSKLQIVTNAQEKKIKDFRIKSSQGNRPIEQQNQNLLERLNSYNNEGLLKQKASLPNQMLPHQVLSNNSKSPIRKIITAQQKKRFSDTFSRYDNSPLSSHQMSSPSRLKSPMQQQQTTAIDFNQRLTVLKFLQKVKTPSKTPTNNQLFK